MTELQTKAIKRIEEALEVASKFYNHEFIMPTVSFKLTGHRAGYAIFAENKIALNNVLLHQNGEDFIKDTPGHEAAHLIARKLYGLFIKSHGSEWQQVMRVIGQDPVRCHSFKVVTKHKYFCKCSDDIYVSTYVHNSIMKGGKLYSCKKCNYAIYWSKMYEKDAVFPESVKAGEKVLAAANS